MNKFILASYTFDETTMYSFCSLLEKDLLVELVNRLKDQTLKKEKYEFEFLGMQIDTSKYYHYKIYTLDEFFERHYMGKHLKI